MRRWIGLAALVALALSVACQQAATPAAPTAAGATPATGSPAAATPAAKAATPAAPAKPTGTLRTGLSDPPRSLDVFVDFNGTVGTSINPVADSLVEFGYDGQLQPALATEWSVAPDNRTYTFKLRQGVRFSNGDPVTAQDVKFSYDTFVDPANTYSNATRIAPFGAASEVIDPQTVRIASRNVDAIFVRRLTFLPIVSERSHRAIPRAEFSQRQQSGTGPFQLRSYTLNQRVTLEPNPNAWRPARIATFDMNALSEQATRVAALRSGDINIASTILPEAADQLRRENVNVLAIPNASVVNILVDSASPASIPALRDRRVREAMNIGLDRQAVVNALLFGFGNPISQVVPDDIFGYGPLPARPFDINRARQLIREAGAEGTQMRMSGAFGIGAGLTSATAAQAIAGSLNQLGLRVEVDQLDFVVYIERYNQGGLGPLALFTLNGVYNDADGILQNFRDQTNPLRATVRYSNPEYDRVFLAAQQELDPARRSQLLQQATRILYDDYASVPVGVTRSQFGFDNRVKNFRPFSTNFWNWQDMTVE